MVARVGTRPAANSGQQQNQNAGKGDFDSAYLRRRPACRLELHCGICRCIFLRYRQNIRADTALRRARDTAVVFV